MSPHNVDHLIRGYIGGLGMCTVQGIDSLLTAIGVAKIPPRPDRGLGGVPVVKPFLRDAGRSGSGSTVDQKVEKAVQEIRAERIGIARADGMSPEEKRRQTDRLDLDLTNLARWVFDKPRQNSKVAGRNFKHKA